MLFQQNIIFATYKHNPFYWSTLILVINNFVQLRDAAKNNPVVFIPSHRSYMDFLLVSYICFTMDIPLPFIAAAADFMNMRVVRTLFRNSGAFYMRRSFMTDPLYWVVFTEYIQNQLQNGDQPLEFFLEGTRSRTGKFLQPKLGRCLYILYEIIGSNRLQNSHIFWERAWSARGLEPKSNL